MTQKRSTSSCPPDARYFDSMAELIDYVRVEHLGEGTPRSRQRAHRDDMTTRGKRLAGSGWSNQR